MLQHISMSIENSLDHIALVGVSTRAMAIHFGFNEEDASMLELAVVEAVTNSVTHAQQTSTQSVNVQISFDGSKIESEISDHGAPFEINKTPQLPGKGAESGYGLFILHSVGEDIRWDRKDGVNTLSFHKTLQQDEQTKEKRE